MSEPDVPKSRSVAAIGRYALGVGCVAVALVTTSLLQSDALFAPLFFLAIILSAWFGGMGQGLFAALLATIFIDYFFLEPLYSFKFNLSHLPQLLVFFISAVMVSSWSAVRRRAETLLRRARDEQEAKVQERTSDLKQANQKLEAEIAERGRVEEMLRQRADLLDLTHDTIFARDMNDIITYWNRGAEELYGWKKHEATGKVSHQLMQTVFPVPLQEINETLFRTDRWEGELIHTKRDGTKVVAASRWSLQRDEHGKALAILETNNDITERRRAEEALRDSEEQWRAVFENNPTMYFMVDADGTVVSVNPFGAEKLGYTVDELVGSPVLNVFYDADREAVQKNVGRCLDQLNQPMNWEARKVRKDGTVLWVRETARAMWLKNRPIVLVVCEDITERKRAEEELAKTEQRLRAVIANAPIILFAVDESGVFTLSEGRGLDDLQLKAGQLVGQSVFDAYRDSPQVLSAIQRALAGESFMDVVEVNGVVFETHYIPVPDEDGQVNGVNGVALNVTERKRAEEELRESENRYRYIFDAAGVSIWEEDFSQVKDLIDELTAAGVDDFRKYVGTHPEFVRTAVPLVKVIDVNTATVKLFKADSKAELLVSLDKIFLPETEEVFAGELIALAEGGTSFESETVLQTVDGQRLTVLFGITFPAQPAKLDSVLVTIMDITERKRAEEELQKTQAELAHIARVTTMGELTSSIAHEVNQPLAAIVTNGNACLRWLSNDPPNVEEARQTVTRMVKDGHRASEVVGRIRAFFRKTAPEKIRLNINQLIQDVIAMVPAELRRNRVEVQTELADDLPPVLADQIQLQQVILNLVINAIEAMSGVSGPRKLLIKALRFDSGSVLVSVQDSGVGFDDQHASQLFNPFYTTKQHGLGMGLSISRTTIEAYGGRLWATPNDGAGSTFQFTLPASDGNESIT